MEFKSLQSTDIVVFVLAYFASRWFMRRLENREPAYHRKKPPSFPALPLVGSLPFLGSGGTELYRYFLAKTSQLGYVYTFRAGARLAYSLIIAMAILMHKASADGSPTLGRNKVQWRSLGILRPGTKYEICAPLDARAMALQPLPKCHTYI